MRAAATLLALAALLAADDAGAARFRARCAELAAQAGPDGVAVEAGGRCFLVKDLRFQAAGVFWGRDAAVLAHTALDPGRFALHGLVPQERCDPLPAIAAVAAQCARAGCALLVVPVPGAAAIYADRLDPALAPGTRVDDALRGFHGALAAAGIASLDLADDLIALRRAGVEPFPVQDCHWSPAAIRVAAARIAERVRAQSWYAAPTVAAPAIAERVVDVHGLLAVALHGDRQPAEPVRVVAVQGPRATTESARTSPLLLIGDAEVLVYGNADGDQGPLRDLRSGLADHLAAELHLPVDLVGVIGDGANAPRVALARRRDDLAGKRCLVWCLDAHALLPAFSGWRPVPGVR